MKTPHILATVYILSAILIDQISKYLAGMFLETSTNTGVAFSVEIPQIVLIPLIIIFIITAIYLAHKYLNLYRNKIAQVLMGMILGGAISNLIDRLLHGHVIDFIRIWKWPVFNFADTFITVGIFSIIIFYDKLRKINKTQK